MGNERPSVEFHPMVDVTEQYQKLPLGEARRQFMLGLPVNHFIETTSKEFWGDDRERTLVRAEKGFKVGTFTGKEVVVMDSTGEYVKAEHVEFWFLPEEKW